MLSSLTLSPNVLFTLWSKIAGLPGGKTVCSWLLGVMVPYSGTIRAQIVQLESGRAVLTLRERRSVRNHLGSVHAMALANLCELGSGLALLSKVATEQRAILVQFSISYSKKGRGTLRVESDTSALTLPREGEVKVLSQITDVNGEEIASATATWRVGVKTDKDTVR